MIKSRDFIKGCDNIRNPFGNVANGFSKKVILLLESKKSKKKDLYQMFSFFLFLFLSLTLIISIYVSFSFFPSHAPTLAIFLFCTLSLSLTHSLSLSSKHTHSFSSASEGCDYAVEQEEEVLSDFWRHRNERNQPPVFPPKMWLFQFWKIQFLLN